VNDDAFEVAVLVVCVKCQAKERTSTPVARVIEFPVGYAYKLSDGQSVEGPTGAFFYSLGVMANPEHHYDRRSGAKRVIFGRIDEIDQTDLVVQCVHGRAVVDRADVVEAVRQYRRDPRRRRRILKVHSPSR
jgi:hypothetical protein